MKATTTLIRTISLILALCLLSSPGFAQSGGLADSNALAYEKALEMLTTSSLTDGNKLVDIRLQFEQAGSYLFGEEYRSFVEAMIILQGEDIQSYDIALSIIRRINSNGSFTSDYYGHLGKSVERILPDLDKLIQYIRARKLEAYEDWEGAIVLYDAYPELDAVTRAVDLSNRLNNEKYTRAIELLQVGSIKAFQQAAGMFEALDDYRDSANKLEECLKRIEGFATPTPKRIPTPGPTKVPTPAPTPVLQPPTSISISITHESLNLRWTLGSGVQKCNIYRANSVDGSYILIATVLGTEYKDNDVDVGETYYYRLSSIKDNTESSVSITRAARLPKPTPTKKPTSTPSLPKVGDTVTFGHYEQDNIITNGKELIAWRVLAIEDGKALLISVSNLDCQPYNNEYKSVTWETCSLRGWLNNSFLNAAFSQAQRDAIVTTRLMNDKNSHYGTSGGKVTWDRVFLLSETEVNRLFSNESDSIARNTPYAIARGASTKGTEANLWWLRSPGKNNKFAYFVNYRGAIYLDGASVNYEYAAVRPVLFIDLSSIIL